MWALLSMTHKLLRNTSRETNLMGVSTTGGLVEIQLNITVTKETNKKRLESLPLEDFWFPVDGMGFLCL